MDEQLPQHGDSARKTAPRRRFGGTHVIVGLGAVAMLAALLLVARGIPARSYDAAAPGTPTSPDGVPAHKLAEVVDANLKYLRDSTDDSPGHYIAVQKSISRSEDNVAAIAQATLRLQQAIKRTDELVGELHATTRRMSADLAAMKSSTDAANESLAALEAHIGELAGLMEQMGGETRGLERQLALIEKTSRAIARGDLAKAVALTGKLNATLPAEVPAAQLTMEAAQ